MKIIGKFILFLISLIVTYADSQVKLVVLEEATKKPITLDKDQSNMLIVREPKMKKDVAEDVVITVFPSSLSDKGFSKLQFTVKGNSEYKCVVDRDYGFCVISYSDVKYEIGKTGASKDKKLLKIQVTCLEGSCEADLQMTNKNFGVIDKSGEIRFTDNEIQLFDIDIPESFQRIIVSIKFTGLPNPVKITNAQLENDSLNFLQKHTVEDQTIFEFDKSDGDFKTEHGYYTVQLIGDKNAVANIQVYNYIEIESLISSERPLLDFANEQSPQAYSLQIGAGEDFEFLKFSMKYVNSNVKANAIIMGELRDEDFLIDDVVKNTVQLAEDKNSKKDNEVSKQFSVIIRKDEVKGSFAKKTFTFIIYSYVTEFVIIEVEKIGDKILPIMLNQIFSASIEQQKFDFYKFKSPNIAKLDESKSMTVTLSSSLGENSLRVKKLNQEYDISQTPPNTSDYAINTSDAGFSIAKFDSECDKSQDFCYYQLYVYNNGGYKSQYQLEIAYTDRDQIVTLKENTSFTDVALSGEYKDYFFKYDNSKKDITSIQIRVSTQLVDLYVAAKGACQFARSDCPNVKRGNDKNPVVITKFQKTYLQGILISVKANRATDFSINIDVNRAKDPTLVELKDGHQTSSEIVSQFPVKYFYFSVDLQKDEDIIINLKAPTNKLYLLVTNDETLPDLGEKEGYQWISSNNFLKISHKSKEFKSQAVYTIAVVGNPEMLKQQGNSALIPFKIMATQSNSVKVMEFNEPFFDISIPKGVQYYETVFDATQTQSVYFSRDILNDESMHDDLVFYLGSELKKNVTEYEFVFKGENQATFELTYATLQRLCKNDEGKLDDSCQIYFAVKNFGVKQISYSMNIWEKNVGIELKEGFQYQFTLFSIDNYQNFYFIPSDRSSSLNFYQYSQYGLTNFTIKAFENTNNISVIDFPFPNDKYGIVENSHQSSEIDYTSGVHHSHSITISPEQMRSYTSNTVILISVGFMEQDDQSEAKAGNDVFKILVSSTFSQVHVGERLEFSLQKQEVRVSFFALKNTLANLDNLYIQLTALSGRASIAVTIKDDHNDRVPQLDDNDFFSNSNYLEITPAEVKRIMKTQKLSSLANPTLVIATQAWESSGKFVLSLTTSTYNSINVLHGVPSEVHLQKDKVAYFKYYHYIGEDIQIRISRDYGMGYYAVLSCQEWQDCEDGEGDLNFLSGQTGSFTEIKKGSSLWCQNCYYLITLMNKDDVDLHAFLYVVVDNDAIWLQEGRNFIDNNDQKELNLYRISVPSNEDANISMVFYWGNPSVYINYYYETDAKKFISGPFKKSDNNVLHISIPARDTVLDQQSKSKNQANKNSDLIITENSLYKNQVENEIYIMVANPEKSVLSSNYSISYSAGELEKYISDGHIMPIQLNKSDTVTFIHQQYEQYDSILTINLENYKEMSMENIQVKVTLQEQESRMQEDFSTDVKDVQLDLFIKAEDHISFSLPNNTGAYRYKITNNGGKQANLTVYINTKDITLMPLDHKVEHFLVPDSINYYEVIVPYKGWIAISTYHCTGFLDIASTQKYSDFVDHKFEQKTETPSVAGHTYLDTFPVKKGALYIALISGHQEGSLYNLKAKFYKKEEDIPHLKLEAGDQGLIMVERSIQGEIFLQFTPLNCLKCSTDELQKARVSYTVIWATDLEILNTMGKCGVSKFFEHEKKDLENSVLFTTKLDPMVYFPKIQSKSFSLDLTQTHKLNYTFPIQQVNVPYVVSIKASVHNFPKIDEDIEITYQNVQVNPTQTYMMTGALEQDLMYFGAICFILFVSLVLCLLFRRLCKSGSSPRKFPVQKHHNNQYGDFYDEKEEGSSENSNISILDTSSHLNENNVFTHEDAPETDRSSQDFTFSKKLAQREGKKQFNKFDDEF